MLIRRCPPLLRPALFSAGHCAHAPLLLILGTGTLLAFLLFKGLPTLGARLFFGDVPALDAAAGAPSRLGRALARLRGYGLPGGPYRTAGCFPRRGLRPVSGRIRAETSGRPHPPGYGCTGRNAFHRHGAVRLYADSLSAQDLPDGSEHVVVSGRRLPGIAGAARTGDHHVRSPGGRSPKPENYRHSSGLHQAAGPRATFCFPPLFRASGAA